MNYYLGEIEYCMEVQTSAGPHSSTHKLSNQLIKASSKELARKALELYFEDNKPDFVGESSAIKTFIVETRVHDTIIGK